MQTIVTIVLLYEIVIFLTLLTYLFIFSTLWLYMAIRFHFAEITENRKEGREEYELG